MKKRAVILEFNRHHGEVIPSLVYLFNRLGFVVDVYVSPRLLALNPLAGMAHLDFNLMPIDRHSFDIALWKDTLSAFDVLVLNTFKTDEVIARFAEIEMPTLLVVHNARVLSESRFTQDYAKPRHREILVLAPHVAAFWKKHDVDSTWIFPAIFPENADMSTDGTSDPRTFCVPGRVRLRRRNYKSMLVAAQDLKEMRSGRFLVKILGKSNSGEAYRLRWSIYARGLRRHFSFSRSMIGHDEFSRELRASTFLCPLIDKEHMSYRHYFEDKASASIPSSVGNNVVPVVHEDLASLYGIGSCAITYGDGKLQEALATAVQLSSSEIENRRSQLSAIRTRFMTQSEENLEAALKKVIGQTS